MKHYTPTKTILLTVLVASAVISTATAGSIFRRDSDKDKQSPPDRSKQADTRTDKKTDKKTDRTDYNRGSATTTRQTSDRPTMRDRHTDDAVPVAPKRDTSRYSDNTRSSYQNDKQLNYRNDSKYYQADERDSYRRNDDHHSDSRYRYDRKPSYRNGYYYYDNSPSIRVEFPCRYGYWVFGYTPEYCVRSAYYYYGYFPYVPSDRVIIVRRPHVTVIESPIIVDPYRRDSGYYLDHPTYDSLDIALSDISRGWMTANPDYLTRYVRSNTQVDIMLDGNYSYSVSGDDYCSMSRDAITSIGTISFTFESIRSRGNDRIVAYGLHRFYASDGNIKTVYVSYTFEKRYGEWVIVEAGSTLRRPY